MLMLIFATPMSLRRRCIRLRHAAMLATPRCRFHATLISPPLDADAR